MKGGKNEGREGRKMKRGREEGGRREGGRRE